MSLMCNRYRAIYGYYGLLEDFSQTKVPIRFPTRDRAPNLPPRWDIRPTNQANCCGPCWPRT